MFLDIDYIFVTFVPYTISSLQKFLYVGNIKNKVIVLCTALRTVQKPKGIVTLNIYFTHAFAFEQHKLLSIWDNQLFQFGLHRGLCSQSPI